MDRANLDVGARVADFDLIGLNLLWWLRRAGGRR